MDTVDCTNAGVRQMKGVQHLSNWKLIVPLLLLTSYTACDISTPSSVPELADSNKQSKNLTRCTGETASFIWAFEIQPFFAVEWFFENIRIAQTSQESFSQDDISIDPNYAYRFHLQTAGKVGFSLTDVTKNDTGTYRCIVTLESTDIPKQFTAELQVPDVDEPLSCGKESDPDDADEQPPASDSSTDATIGIVVTVCIVGTAVVVVIVIKRKRNNHTEQGSAGPDGNGSEETGPESHKLVVHEDQTRQPDKQTCEQMNLTQTC